MKDVFVLKTFLRAQEAVPLAWEPVQNNTDFTAEGKIKPNELQSRSFCKNKA